MPSLNLTDEQVIAIRQAVLNKTKTKNEIAAEYNIGERSIRNLLTGFSYGHVKDSIIPGKPYNNGISDEKRQQIVELYAQTHSMYVVAETVGVSRNTISNILKKHGIKPDGKTKSIKQRQATQKSNQRRASLVYKPAPLTQKKAATLQKLIAAKWNSKEIAEMLDLSCKDVRYFIKNGIV